MNSIHRYHAIAWTAVLVWTLNACCTKDPAPDASPPPEASAESPSPPPSKAEATRVAEDPATDPARQTAASKTEKENANLEKIYGEWVLDTQKIYQQLSDIERQHMGSMIQNTALSFTFFADGTLLTRGASMGFTEERRGTFRHVDTEEQTLILALHEEDITNDQGEVINRGATTTIRAKFLNDHTLEWTRHTPAQGIKNPYQSQTMFLTRDPTKLQKFQQDLEEAQKPRAIEIPTP